MYVTNCVMPCTANSIELWNFRPFCLGSHNHHMPTDVDAYLVLVESGE